MYIQFCKKQNDCHSADLVRCLQCNASHEEQLAAAILKGKHDFEVSDFYDWQLRKDCVAELLAEHLEVLTGA